MALFTALIIVSNTKPKWEADGGLKLHFIPLLINNLLCILTQFVCQFPQLLIFTHKIGSVLFCFHYPTRDLQERQGLI